MALRRVKRHKATLFSKLFKGFLYILLGIFALFIASILYFNGETIKKPLETYLQNKTQLNVSIEKAEFSPLYPNTLKLYNVKIDKYQASEIYIEYDLIQALVNDSLIIDYLYIKKPQYKSLELGQKNLQNAFKYIYADIVHIEDTAIDIKKLNAKLANIDIKQLKLSNDISYSSMVYNLAKGSIYGLDYKSMSFNLKKVNNKTYLHNLNMQTLGGSISTKRASLGDSIDIDLLYGSNLILKDDIKLNGIKINIENLNLQNSFVQYKDLILNNVTGSFKNIVFDNKIKALSFVGNVDALSYKDLLTVTNASINSQLLDNNINLKLDGTVFEGSISTNIAYNFNDKILNVDNLNLAHNKIEFNDAHLALLNDSKALFKILNLDNVVFDDLNLLSFVKTIPLSIKSLNGNILKSSFNTYDFSKEPNGFATISASSILYSDLYIKHIDTNLTLSNGVYFIAFPDITFRKSSLSIASAISDIKSKSFLTIKAHNFDVSELNSSLLDNLFAGTIDLDFELQSDDIKDLSLLKGNLLLKSNDLLISKFGLDLINGGDNKELNLDKTQLLTALSDSDLGLYDLVIEGNLNKNKAFIDAKASIATGSLKSNLIIDLKDMQAHLDTTIKSLTKDSITKLSSTIKDNNPIFNIKPIIRGQKRPGLFIKTDFKVKEQSDPIIKKVVKKELKSTIDNNKEKISLNSEHAHKDDSNNNANDDINKVKAKTSDVQDKTTAKSQEPKAKSTDNDKALNSKSSDKTQEPKGMSKDNDKALKHKSPDKTQDSKGISTDNDKALNPKSSDKTQDSKGISTDKDKDLKQKLSDKNQGDTKDLKKEGTS